MRLIFLNFKFTNSPSIYQRGEQGVMMLSNGVLVIVGVGMFSVYCIWWIKVDCMKVCANILIKSERGHTHIGSFFYK
jgi:hypothetical protein